MKFNLTPVDQRATERSTLTQLAAAICAAFAVRNAVVVPDTLNVRAPLFMLVLYSQFANALPDAMLNPARTPNPRKQR